MEIKNQIKIDMSLDDIKDAIIKTIYREKGISGIFNVKFNIKRDNLNVFVLQGAEIIIDYNTK